MSDETTTTTTETTTQPATSTDSSNWIDNLPDDIKNDATLVNFKGKDVTEVVKSYVSAQRLLGSSIRIPGPDASVEAKAEFMKKVESVPGITRLPDEKDSESVKAFYSKLGRPSTAEGYKFTVPEGIKLDDDATNVFKSVAYNAGLTNKQAEALVMFDVQRNQELIKAIDAGRNQSEVALKKEWGTEYDTRIDLAKGLLTHFENKFPDAAKELKTTAVGNNPIVLMALAELSKVYKESNIIKGESTAGGLTPEEAKARIQEIRANKAHPFNSNRNDKTHQDAVKEMNTLYAHAFPVAE